MFKFKRLALAAMMAGAPLLASAAPTQLAFILDRSNSISEADFSIITAGLGTAIGSFVPVDGSYEVTVVTFSTAGELRIDGFLVDSLASRAALAAQITALGALGTTGTTNYQAAFSTMLAALTNGTGTTIAAANATYLNFATDGVASTGQAGIVERNALITAGVDNISIEGIGTGVDALDLQTNYCYPGPCDATAPYNFPTQGFYIGVDSAAEYAAAIGLKIQTVTGQLPEPASLALVGLALLGAGVARRRAAA